MLKGTGKRCKISMVSGWGWLLLKKKSSLSVTWAGSTVNSWHDALLPFALSHWASHPSVSVFVLSWQQQYDRSWVGVRDELWGNGQDFTRRTEGERVHGTRKSALIQRRRGSIYLPLSLLRGTMLLSCLADLKSAKPSICEETRARLVNKRPAFAMGVHFIKSRERKKLQLPAAP